MFTKCKIINLITQKIKLEKAIELKTLEYYKMEGNFNDYDEEGSLTFQ